MLRPNSPAPSVRTTAQIPARCASPSKMVGRSRSPATQIIRRRKARCVPKSAAMRSASHHPYRLTTPMKRVGRKGEGRFEPISWDGGARTGGIASVGDRSRAPEAIVPYSYAGTMGLVQGDSIAQRFFHKLGASQLDRTICAAAGAAGLKYTYGASLGMHTEFFAESELILIWGANPIASNLHFWTRAQEAKRRGAQTDRDRSISIADCGKMSSAHCAQAWHRRRIGARHDQCA